MKCDNRLITSHTEVTFPVFSFKSEFISSKSALLIKKRWFVEGAHDAHRTVLSCTWNDSQLLPHLIMDSDI